MILLIMYSTALHFIKRPFSRKVNVWEHVIIVFWSFLNNLHWESLWIWVNNRYSFILRFHPDHFLSTFCQYILLEMLLKKTIVTLTKAPLLHSIQYMYTLIQDSFLPRETLKRTWIRPKSKNLWYWITYTCINKLDFISFFAISNWLEFDIFVIWILISWGCWLASTQNEINWDEITSSIASSIPSWHEVYFKYFHFHPE